MAGELAYWTFGYNFSLIVLIASFIGLIVMYMLNRKHIINLSMEGIPLMMAVIFVIALCFTLVSTPMCGMEMMKLSQ